jgi:hypothetical protein
LKLKCNKLFRMGKRQNRQITDEELNQAHEVYDPLSNEAKQVLADYNHHKNGLDRKTPLMIGDLERFVKLAPGISFDEALAADLLIGGQKLERLREENRNKRTEGIPTQPVPGEGTREQRHTALAKSLGINFGPEKKG